MTVGGAVFLLWPWVLCALCLSASFSAVRGISRDIAQMRARQLLQSWRIAVARPHVSGLSLRSVPDDVLEIISPGAAPGGIPASDPVLWNACAAALEELANRAGEVRYVPPDGWSPPEGWP